MKSIYEEIDEERMYQNNKWGTSFDDKNTVNDWVTYITQYASKGATIVKDDQLFRDCMIKVAALAVASIEAYERNGSYPNRHYDKPEVI